MPDQEALAEAPGQEASAEPSASAAGLPKPIPDSIVWSPETIEEALAEVLEQEASADPSASAAGQENQSLPALSVWPWWHWLSQTLQPFRCLTRLLAGRLWRIWLPDSLWL